MYVCVEGAGLYLEASQATEGTAALGGQEVDSGKGHPQVRDPQGRRLGSHLGLHAGQQTFWRARESPGAPFCLSQLSPAVPRCQSDLVSPRPGSVALGKMGVEVVLQVEKAAQRQNMLCDP